MKDLKRSWHRRSLKRKNTQGGKTIRKKADNKSTGLTGHSGGLTGRGTGLTGAPYKSGNSSKIKARPSFKELLAKYEKQEVTRKKKKQPDEAKDMRSSFKP